MSDGARFLLFSGYFKFCPAMSHMPALEATTLPADAVEVGRIADAWGIKGWFKVLSHSSDPQALFAAKEWFLLPAEKGAKHFTGTVLLPVKQARVHADTVVATSPAVEDRNGAEALRGARVFVARENFPQTEDGEYYWIDLIGLRCTNGERLFGEITEIFESGAHPILRVKRPDGDPKAATGDELIPFVDAIVRSVDLAARRVDVDWEGLD